MPFVPRTFSCVYVRVGLRSESSAHAERSLAESRVEKEPINGGESTRSLRRGGGKKEKHTQGGNKTKTEETAHTHTHTHVYAHTCVRTHFIGDYVSRYLRVNRNKARKRERGAK